MLNGEDSGIMRSDFKALNIPFTRLQDSSLIDGGLKLVDADIIFANFHADENDPCNYCFVPCDDYIANTLALGTKIFYRHDVSTDFTLKEERTQMPPDPKNGRALASKLSSITTNVGQTLLRTI